MERFTYTPKPIEYGKRMGWEAIGKAIDENWAHLEECDRKAQEAGQLVGRYITHAYADGQAVYQIIKESKLSVRILVCGNLGDDWILPAWGEECKITKEQALQFLGFRDGLRRLFAKKD